MSVLISGVLINPAGAPVSGAEITFTALTTSDSVLNGFSASTVTNDDGEYAIPLEHSVYSIAIQIDGYNSIYGSVSINEKSTPATINELLKLAAMEQAVTPAIIVYFREIQTDVAAKLATVQTLSNNATTAARDATTARNEAAQYAQNLSTALAQAQQASTSATASANMATQSANKADSAKNAAEAAAGNAQATLTDVMKKSANGADIADAAQFRNNIGMKNAATHDVQTSATDATAGLVLKIANNGEGPFGLGSRGTTLNTTDVVVQLRSAVNGWYRCAINTVRAPSTGAWTFLVMKWDDNTRCVLAISAVTGQGVQFITIGTTTDSGWTPLWGQNNLTFPLTKSNGGSGKNSGSVANSPTNTGPQTLTEFLETLDMYGNNVAGSANVTNDGGVWHSYLSVRHRSGESDGINWGWVLEDRNMTGSTNDFFIRKRVSAGWMAPVALWHSQNLPNPATLNTEQIFTGIKFLQAGSEPLRLAAPSSGAAAYLSIYDVNRTTRKGWFGRGSANDSIQMQNDVTGAGVTLSQDGNINLNSPNGVVNWNGQQVLMSGNTQTITGAKTFTSSPIVRGINSTLSLVSQGVAESAVGSWVQIINQGNAFHFYVRAGNSGAPITTGERVITMPTSATGTLLATGNNAIADSGGFWKTASPVINIYADGSFTTTDEAEGVNVERLSEGVYKITGCQGMHPDAAWNGMDGGVSNPKCRNGLELTWNDFSVESDGSVIVRTYHRPHSDAISFARNEIEGYENGDPIDVPRGLFIQVRVNMPEREELKPHVIHSNVYCGTVSIAGAIPQ